MFQGIVEQTGVVLFSSSRALAVKPRNPWKTKPGESVSVNGTCLTVVRNTGGTLHFDLGTETSRLTTLGSLQKGSIVNLERPLRLSDRISGHLMTGHVEAVGRIESNSKILRVRFKAPAGAVVRPKGSIALDGVSLTLNSVRRHKDQIIAEVCLIPETLKRTNLGLKKPGDWVNIETDYLAKMTLRSVYA